MFESISSVRKIIMFPQTMLKRKPEFYVWVLLVPSFIITTVSLFGIFIPTNHLGDREEKVRRSSMN